MAHWGLELSLMPPGPDWGRLLAVTPAGNIRYCRLALQAMARERGPLHFNGFLPAGSSGLICMVFKLFTKEPWGSFRSLQGFPKFDDPSFPPSSSKEHCF